jgi:hypothetical protein
MLFDKTKEININLNECKNISKTAYLYEDQQIKKNLF